MSKKVANKYPNASHPGIFASFMFGLANRLNRMQNGANSLSPNMRGNVPTPRVKMSSSPMNAGMRGVGLNPAETFAMGWEQIFSPVFAYDQRRPQQVVDEFNNWGNMS